MDGASPILPLGQLPEPSVAGSTTCPPEKCNAVGCRRPISPIMDCFAAECKKKVHTSCFERAVLKKFGVDPLIDPVSGAELYTCGKTCYNAVHKAIVLQPSRVPWDKDGRDRPNDKTNCSLNVLLMWLCTEGNYAQYRGGGKHDGKRKIAYGLQIANLI